LNCAKDYEIIKLFVNMEVTLHPEAVLLPTNVTQPTAELVLLDPVSAALVNAAKEGNMGVICVCLNNGAYIESKDEVYSYCFRTAIICTSLLS
jgi:hypothetical protein